MITLRVIVEEMLSTVPSGTSRYAEELTRALIATTPPGCTVEGIVAASTEGEYADILDRLPGLKLHKSALDRRQLVAAWQHGFTTMPGMLHAPTLLAPLSKHERIHARGQQTVVTLHDVTAWVRPESADSRGANWAMTMAKRAHRYADALVVPTHAVARQLAEFLDFGDRVRVIGGAVSPSLIVPADADERAERLGLPTDGYLVTLGGLEERRGLEPLLRALSFPDAGDIPLLVVGPDDNGSGSIAAAASAAGLGSDRVRALGSLQDADFSVVLDRATAFVLPSLLEGFGLQLLESFHFGTPVIHSDTDALVEIAGDAGITVELDDAAGYPERLAAAIDRVAGDSALRGSLAISGMDRARLFDWQISAEKVWQLHADL